MQRQPASKLAAHLLAPGWAVCHATAHATLPPAGGALGQLHVAFSRERTAKEYVQHLMEARAQELWVLLQPGGHGVLYVCGDASHMAKDVHRTLHTIVIKVRRHATCDGTWARLVLRGSGGDCR